VCVYVYVRTRECEFQMCVNAYAKEREQKRVSEREDKREHRTREPTHGGDLTSNIWISKSKDLIVRSFE